MPKTIGNVYYAHTPPQGEKHKEWEALEIHLLEVAKKTTEFAKSAAPHKVAFAETAFLAGCLHDLGKYRQEFQDYLFGKRKSSIDTHHAAYGSAAAICKYKSPEAMFAIAGHHSGLHNKADIKELFQRYSAVEICSPLIDIVRTYIAKIPDKLEHPTQECKNDSEKLDMELKIRILFSCLVDADRLATEEYTSGELPKIPVFNPEKLLNQLLSYVANMSKSGNMELQKLRNSILESAISKGQNPTGFFSMTVPTGGGKTLSSMAFALAHAKKHVLKRVIVIIPYMSIIEQNADVYRKVFGDELVVEHHSSVAVPEENADNIPSVLEFAIENWDFPIIVTTSVQFIESLFARSPSKCRKLHNIAQSVIIIDEVQTMPIHLLNPTLSVLKGLVKEYGSSILLCSATQPGFLKNINLAEGFSEGYVTEIAPNPTNLFKNLRRVSYNFDYERKISWDELSCNLVKLKQVLIVVNTRKHAFALWQKLRSKISEKESIFHLSSSMCAEHRHNILKKIKEHLENKKSCYLVSTQLIEAGVDIDFPVVYRALAPLDSIVQAAGRCNREGKLKNNGNIYIFNPEDGGMPRGLYSSAASISAGLLTESGMDERLATDPSIFTPYFSRLHNISDTDFNKKGKQSIQECRKNLNFKKTAERAHVINDSSTSVVVKYGGVEDIITEIREKYKFRKFDLRRLQRFMVSLRDFEFNKLQNYGSLIKLRDDVDIFVLEEHCYSVNVGVTVEQRPLEDFCVW